ncbi:hypothetical protein EJB05_24126 [Eragrostis curvula]|uniref:DUF4218 domain-containing protein n=1 Tax=Eragrostis curvula TaxID=38414 RepID=A0A5J9V8U4_9POAL|nr:hypothetical protein EJB05_24126 [Eragrostis curvula]
MKISELTKDIKTTFGKLQKSKNDKKRKACGDQEADDDNISSVFTKRSCFFQLPYWETVLLRHNLDPMHVEHNVFNNATHTLLGDKKSKDNLNARLDLKEMGIRPDLHPCDAGNKSYMPAAKYSLNPQEKRLFCEVLKGVRFPDGYASSLDSKVSLEENRIIGNKTHDSHVIMHDLLPLAINNILPERVCVPLMRLSNYFKKLYSKVISVSEIQKLEAEIYETLCLLENIFPPSFFTIMVHLTTHLATEVMLGGPVHYRNMYPIERYLSTLKNMVRTRSHPEGAIAEGYLFAESLTFCSQYLHDCETKFSRTARHNDNINPSVASNQFPYLRKVGRPLLGSCAMELDHTSWVQAQRYVLINYPHITSYVEMHLQILSADSRLSKRSIEQSHHKNFHHWFSDYVQQLIAQGNEVPEEVKVLAQKPYRMKINFFLWKICQFLCLVFTGKMRIGLEMTLKELQLIILFLLQGKMYRKRERDKRDEYSQIKELNIPSTKIEDVHDVARHYPDRGMKAQLSKTSESSEYRFYNPEPMKEEGFSDDGSGSEDDGSGSEDDSGSEHDETEIDHNGLGPLNNHDISEPQVKRRGRGPTKMESLWKEHDPNNKINLKLNRFGQPCGLKTCKLTNFIGTLVKGKEISLAAKNWSKVDKSVKEKLWLTVQSFFNVDESLKRWILRSASKKWKDFKAEINNKFEANPSLANEEVHDGDVYSGLFPKERNGTWRGLGLLVGGSNSRNLAEIKAELQDTRNENSKLWSMVETLMKNQSDLQQQHNELKQMWLASQDHKPSDSCQKNEEQPKEPMEDMEFPEDRVKVASVLSRNVKISKAQAKVSFETDNHEKATSLSSRNSKRSEVFNETEQEAVSPQQLSMKRQIAQPKEKTPPRVLRQKTKVSATNQSLHKKSRKFQTPLQKDDVREIITRGAEVGLVTSQSDIMVALATVISTSCKSRPADGKIHHDCVEVLVNSVFNKTIGLPYPEGKIIMLSSAIGHCIPWPRNDLVPISMKVRIMPTIRDMGNELVTISFKLRTRFQ